MGVVKLLVILKKPLGYQPAASSWDSHAPIDHNSAGPRQNLPADLSPEVAQKVLCTEGLLATDTSVAEEADQVNVLKFRFC
jgi:hypothetical protein